MSWWILSDRRILGVLLSAAVAHLFSDLRGDEPVSAGAAEILYRQPLDEAGQSGICLWKDHLYLTLHKRLDGPLSGGFCFNSDIIAQCLDRTTGRKLWQVDLPGTYAGKVLESWHDSTSLLPVANEQFVVFQNLNGMLQCCTHDGRTVWHRTWQAPDPDIKNCRMFLLHNRLIVALPADRIAVAASAQHPALPFYQLHCIDLVSGADIWRSPHLITHATQYSLDRWKETDVIVASMIDLSHWQFGRGRRGFLISTETGESVAEFDLPPAIPHQKNQLCQGRFLVTGSGGPRTVFQLVEPSSGAVHSQFVIADPDVCHAWTGTNWEVAEFQPEYTDRTLRGKGQPTPSTVHVVGSRIYFWRYDSGEICCLDTETGESVFVEVPIQVLPDRIVWNRADFQFTDGIRNTRDQIVNQRVGSVRGIQRGGFGHTNPAWPLLRDGVLYWQGGAGLLYLIDTNVPFSPAAISWRSIETQGQSWTFGEPAVDDEAIYVRSQRELVRMRR